MVAEFWSTYYRSVFERAEHWLDYSNERVQAQTFGLILEAAGAMAGRHCLDIGCGWGQLSRVMHSLGAASVTGVDIVPEAKDRLENEYPYIRWICANIGSDSLDIDERSIDIALLVEVLQYTPFQTTFEKVWNLIAPGGRIVAMVPNADCPLVNKTKTRFEGQYRAPSVSEIMQLLPSLNGIENWGWRGLFFDEDQSIAPYQVTPWSREQNQQAPPPNRLQLVAIKKAD